MNARGLTLLLTTLALVACGERDQVLHPGSAAKLDRPAHQGTGVTAYTQPGWTVGHADSWAQGLRARGQYGQNEYSRTTSR